MIIIFSRPVHTGKTSELFQFCRGRTDIAGILMPDVEGRRMFYDIAAREYFTAEAGEENADEELLEVGRFQFLATTFTGANTILIRTLLSTHSVIIVDEVGKLELRNEGLYPAIRQLISEVGHKKDLVLVVRHELVEQVKQTFQLNQVIVINDLKTLSFPIR